MLRTKVAFRVFRVRRSSVSMLFILLRSPFAEASPAMSQSPTRKSRLYRRPKQKQTPEATRCILRA